MEKAVLISIRPNWVQKIIDGEKTVEIRKTRPKIEPPFKCYIYCTQIWKYVQGKSVKNIWINRGTDNRFIGNGKVIGEFVCDEITKFKNSCFDENFRKAVSLGCIRLSDLAIYLCGKHGYAWHISDLKIYDVPKELSDFRIPKKCNSCKVSGYENCCPYDEKCIVPAVPSRPPQSWCYVEEAMDTQKC